VPKTANFGRRFAVSGKLGDREPERQRILLIVSRYDRGQRDHIAKLKGERCVGERAGRIADPITADRRLVEHEREGLFRGANGRQRRRCGFDIGERRPRRNEAQVGGADGGIESIAPAAGGIDDRERDAVGRELAQTRNERMAFVNALDRRRGAVAAQPLIGDGAERIGFDHANVMTGFQRGAGQSDRERALAGAAFA